MQVHQRGLMAALLMATLVAAPLAEAKRAGGGKSHGMSRSSSSSQSYQPSRQATPAPQQQTATHMASKKSSALYVTGEESLSQVALRAQRLDLPTDSLKVMAETCVERICEVLAQERPAVAILDSIQTLYTETLQSAPGGVSQIRESVGRSKRWARKAT